MALDVHSDLGATFQGGLGAFGGKLLSGDRVWYQNMRQIDYNGPMSLQALGLDSDFTDAEIAQRLDAAAKKDAVVFYMHPCIGTCKQFWDARNMRKGNWVEFGHWLSADPRAKADTKHFYERFRAFIRRVKADSRFVFTDCEQLLATEKPRVKIRCSDVPAIRAALMKELGPLDAPASWSVADCFLAAVGFLRSETEYTPGKTYGFLEKPEGVKTPVTVKAADLRAAATKLVVKRHLPVKVDVGGVALGPADFLFAALDALATGQDEVRVVPRDQLGALGRHVPCLQTFTHDGKWIFTPEMKDHYLADRLRWQFWTMRYE